MMYLMSEPELDPSLLTTTLAIPSPFIHFRILLYSRHGGTKVGATELRFSRNWCLVDTHTQVAKTCPHGLEALGLDSHLKADSTIYQLCEHGKPWPNVFKLWFPHLIELPQGSKELADERCLVRGPVHGKHSGSIPCFNYHQPVRQQ